ncbi:MAG: AI-2E family transporter [Gemmatimonadota bacterium]|jgi:predicted PurR-regulated permease PerM|nr:MAG: AI-2E family transporter [Gemmatimonadota bacterium]
MQKAIDAPTDPKLLRSATDIFIHVALIAIMAVWCFRIFEPFLMPVMWGLIIAVALFPIFRRFRSLLGGRSGLTGLLFALIALVLVIYPTVQISASAVQSVSDLHDRMEAGTLAVPPPSESVADWPVIGEQTHRTWSQASVNLESTLEEFEPQIRALVGRLVGFIGGFGLGILQTILAIIIAGFLFTYEESGRGAAHTLSVRIAGKRGALLPGLIASTIRSVAQGVLGVALVQTLLAGLGMAIYGIPHWGLWTALVLPLAVVQLPPLLVLAPVAIWAFADAGTTTGTIVFAIYALVVSFSDTFLKPLFLGRGVEIPMPVILIGAIGGVMLSGVIGLFVGAVVLAIGWKLLQVWINPDLPMPEVEAAAAEGPPSAG